MTAMGLARAKQVTVAAQQPGVGLTDSNTGFVRRPVWRDLLPAGALLVVGLMGLLLAFLSQSENNGQYMIVTAPWASTGQTLAIVAESGGGLMDITSLSNVLIVGSDLPDFGERMRAAGIWMIFPAPIATGCIAATPEQRA